MDEGMKILECKIYTGGFLIKIHEISHLSSNHHVNKAL